MVVFTALILLSSVWIFRAPSHRAAIRAVLRLIARRLRIEMKTHRLEDLVEQMVDLAIASSVPSVTRTYLPTAFCFGISAADEGRWGALLSLVACETSELVVARSETVGYHVLATPQIAFAVSGAVRPGRVAIIRVALKVVDEAARTTPMATAS